MSEPIQGRVRRPAGEAGQPPRSRAARRRASAEERRAQILDAALQCFAERGYHLATMDDVVRASGLSKGSLYWHFQSKEEVLLALFDAFVEEMFAAWSAVVAAEAEMPALDALRGHGRIALERLCRERRLLHAWVEFLAHPIARARLAEAYAETRARLGALLRRGIERGELRAVPVESVAAGLVAAVEGLVLQAMVDPELDAIRHWNASFDVQARGLGR